VYLPFYFVRGCAETETIILLDTIQQFTLEDTLSRIISKNSWGLQAADGSWSVIAPAALSQDAPAGLPAAAHNFDQYLTEKYGNNEAAKLERIRTFMSQEGAWRVVIW
jgi:hypothetical protein